MDESRSGWEMKLTEAGLDGNKGKMLCVRNGEALIYLDRLVQANGGALRGNPGDHFVFAVIAP